ncbi:MAG: hypothetical protein QXU18_14070 [Thermoplasmatales archaeon]
MMVHQVIGTDSDLTVGEIKELMEKYMELYPHRYVYFSGDYLAIMSEPKSDYIFIKDQIIFPEDVYRK